MKLIELASGKEINTFPNGNITAAIGNFDGVHCGHLRLINYAKKSAEQGGKSAVFTFSTPSSLCLGRTNELLTSVEERLSLFRKSEIDYVLMEDFENIRHMTTESFSEMLVKYGIKTVVCGTDFRYGQDAVGTADTLKKELSSLGGTAVVLPPVEAGGLPISATRIRTALQNGELEAANAMLGRCYSVTSTVTVGKQLGRTLGFPTANLSFPGGYVIPKFGVYAVRAFIGKNSYCGVSNVGLRPTVENAVTANCETHILHYDGDLYGTELRIEFCKFLRAEEKFENAEALCRAVKHDIVEARAYFHC